MTAGVVSIKERDSFNQGFLVKAENQDPRCEG